MTDEVAGGGLLARYILTRRHIRSSNDTVKPEAFMPHPYIDLSVTRHKGITVDQLWSHGRSVAEQQSKTLYGRSDIDSSDVMANKLTVQSDPTPENPNHANILGWSGVKSEQKLVALELAKKASKIIYP